MIKLSLSDVSQRSSDVSRDLPGQSGVSVMYKDKINVSDDLPNQSGDLPGQSGCDVSDDLPGQSVTLAGPSEVQNERDVSDI